MLLNARKVFYAEGTHTTTLLAFEELPTVCRSSPASF
jgi:hypothetical protein